MTSQGRKVPTRTFLYLHNFGNLIRTADISIEILYWFWSEY